MNFTAHNAKIELVNMMNDGLLTTEEMCNAWNIVDDAEQDQVAAETVAHSDSGTAEYDFYMFCEDGPGAHAAAVLAKMGAVNDGSKRFWKRALACAQLSRAAWLAA